MAVAILPRAVRADVTQDAQRLSDTAFTMLNALSSSSAPGASEAQGAIASFAGDAQSLASALGRSDNAAAGQAMAALVADRRSVDKVVAQYPGAINTAQWAELKSLLVALERDVPASHWKEVPPAAAAAAAAAAGAPDVPPPPSETAMLGPAPVVKVTSRVFESGGVRVLGYIDGTDLQSAGIYEGDNLLHPIQLGSTKAEQRINFNFKLIDANGKDTIRVTDAVGRTAEARVAPQMAIAAPSSSGDSKLIEIGPDTGVVSSGSTPMEVASGTANIYEIPSHKGVRRPRFKGPNGASELADVQVNILGVLGTSTPDTYQVVGQITGSGIYRAGIYVDGKLVKPIPLTAAYTSFDVAFTKLGKRASIRVYDRHNNFVESQIDTNTGAGQVFGSNPPLLNPFGVSPYTSPYTYSYPANPYMSPYVNPYGSVNPYAPRPYGAPGYGVPW